MKQEDYHNSCVVYDTTLSEPASCSGNSHTLKSGCYADSSVFSPPFEGTSSVSTCSALPRMAIAISTQWTSVVEYQEARGKGIIEQERG